MHLLKWIRGETKSPTGFSLTILGTLTTAILLDNNSDIKMVKIFKTIWGGEGGALTVQVHGKVGILTDK